MKTIFLSVAIFATLMQPCISNAAQKGKTPKTSGAITVSGRIEGHGGRIFLITKPDADKADTIGNIVTPDGNFSFKANVTKPTEARITAAATQVSVPIILEPGCPVKVEAYTDGRPWNISGEGQLTKSLKEYRELMAENINKRDSIEKYYKENHDMSDYFWVIQARGALQKEQERFEKAEDQFLKNNDNIVSAMMVNRRLPMLRYNKTLHLKYDLLGENARNTPSGKELEQPAKSMASISQGGIAPDFTMETPEGGKLSLHGVKAKVKILDFWASWCGPCRAENPNVKRIYDEFHPKGLEIISISLDDKREPWVKAIEKDGMNWLHASDLGKGDTARKLYNVTGVPYMLILDENNRIISEGLRGDKLHDFIASQFENK